MIGLGNDLLLDNTHALPDPMLAYHQDQQEYNAVYSQCLLILVSTEHTSMSTGKSVLK